MANDSLKPLILTALASGRPTFYEAMPDSFGSDAQRWDLLRECLLALLKRHDGLEIRLVGSQATLEAFGLRPGIDELIGSTLVAVTQSATATSHAIRLVFRRAAPRAIPGQPRKRHDYL